MSGTEAVTGTVTAFDDPRGIGTVTTDDGRTLPFHCTAIAGGSRTITVGTLVVVDVGPGLPGRWEAVAVRVPTATSGSAPRRR